MADGESYERLPNPLFPAGASPVKPDNHFFVLSPLIILIKFI